jgi:hypothetical protein
MSEKRAIPTVVTMKDRTLLGLDYAEDGMARVTDWAFGADPFSYERCRKANIRNILVRPPAGFAESAQVGRLLRTRKTGNRNPETEIMLGQMNVSFSVNPTTGDTEPSPSLNTVSKVGVPISEAKKSPCGWYYQPEKLYIMTNEEKKSEDSDEKVFVPAPPHVAQLKCHARDGAHVVVTGLNPFKQIENGDVYPLTEGLILQCREERVNKGHGVLAHEVVVKKIMSFHEWIGLKFKLKKPGFGCLLPDPDNPTLEIRLEEGEWIRLSRKAISNDRAIVSVIMSMGQKGVPYYPFSGGRDQRKARAHTMSLTIFAMGSGYYVTDLRLTPDIAIYERMARQARKQEVQWLTLGDRQPMSDADRADYERLQADPQRVNEFLKGMSATEVHDLSVSAENRVAEAQAESTEEEQKADSAA